MNYKIFKITRMEMVINPTQDISQELATINLNLKRLDDGVNITGFEVIEGGKIKVVLESSKLEDVSTPSPTVDRVIDDLQDFYSTLCDECSGTGAIDKARQWMCNKCKGTGRI